MSEKANGDVFFFNMTPYQLDLVLNDAVIEPIMVEPIQLVYDDEYIPDPKSQFSVSGMQYKISSQAAPRVPLHRPVDQAAFGVKNKLYYWFEKEKRDFYTSEIFVDTATPGTLAHENLRVYIYEGAVILTNGFGRAFSFEVIKSEDPKPSF